MKNLIIIFFIIFSVILIGCENSSLSEEEIKLNQDFSNEQTEDLIPIEDLEPEPKPEEKIIIETEIEPEFSVCQFNTDCTGNEQCIEDQCKLVEKLYKTEGCQQKCTYNAVVVKTSDGETYNLARGQGSYTGAGALGWTLLGGPRYCQEGSPPVPIKIIKYNAGKILSEQVIVLNEGKKSKTITHPTVKRISFTVTLESLNEECL